MFQIGGVSRDFMTSAEKKAVRDLASLGLLFIPSSRPRYGWQMPDQQPAVAEAGSRGSPHIHPEAEPSQPGRVTQ